MGLFGKGFTHAGSGISKTAPKKKGFFRYWELFRTKFWKLIELNIFYTLFFIPLIAAAVGLILMLSGSDDRSRLDAYHWRNAAVYDFIWPCHRRYDENHAELFRRKTNLFGA